MTTIEKTFPAGWLPESQYHPEEHLSKARKNSEKNDYLNIAQRMVWFVQEQRQLIAAGLATCPFILKADLIELDLDKGRAVFKATARDVLGNESVEYGSESKADFNDFVEKAATKAKGRALASLGYGTQFSPELDEGERIADAPKEQRQQAQQPQQNRQPAQQPRQQPSQPKPQPAPAKPAAQQPAAPAQAAKPALSPREVCWGMAQPIGYDTDGFDDLIQQYTFDGRTQWGDVKAHLGREQAKAGNGAQPAPAAEEALATDEPPANEQQMLTIRKLCAQLGRETPTDGVLTFAGASALIRQLSKDFNAQRRRAS